MYGVVLWKDIEQDRAVIWCEDHGDLAFYRGDTGDRPATASMNPGDLVSFDLSEGGEMRLARTPRLVATDTHPALTEALREAGRSAGALAHTGEDVGTDPDGETPRADNVVVFPAARCRAVA